ncbi:DMT family transporter [Rhodovulum visakhapatnamense]|uniref:Putative membrane protein n=1 Tax=Rhodovulum visakhapatnamense TaxID=364297 RepID=A0A4R8FSE2_9RHOB|nr:DMT family transporter [Rhodovulum visakhapatnamense]TDX26855.1 putative membrane protein [Rhodovulum visakhapatnamense]
MSLRTRIEQENALGGILTICAGIMFLVLNDAIAKVLTDRYHPVHIVFLRNLIAIPIILAAVLALHGAHALRTRNLGLHAWRGLIMVAAASLYFTSLSVMPLAEATVLVFAAPIFITALSVPLLGEHVGWRRWSAVLVGFIGVLIIVQPGASTFQLASLMPVGVAFLYALMMLSGRWLDPGEGLLTMMLYVVLFPMVYAAPVALWLWTPVQPADLWLFLVIAICGSLGIALISQAFRMAPAAVVAPFDYTSLIWATALGWLIWGDLLTPATVMGALVIIASGIFIVVREASR